MFDTMTGVKIVGGFCGALLVYLLGGWFAEIVYTGGGHGGDHQAYIIPVEGEDAGGAAETEEVPFSELFAAADAGAGERLFRQCSACHKLDGSNTTGPHLDGVVGRAVGEVSGFSYSPAMSGHGGDWTPEELNDFITRPSDAVPGTKMTYAGMKKAQDRANLIAYLQSVGG